MYAALITALLAATTSSCPSAEQVAVIGGARLGAVCLDDAVAAGFVIVDLRDDWVPLVLADTPYAATWIGLADERFDVVGSGPRAAEDRYLEPWGIVPNLSVLLRRLDDRERHHCDALVDNDALRALTQPLRLSRAPPARRGSNEAVNALHGHLVCEGLLDAAAADGVFGPATTRALTVWQRKEALYGEPGVLDDESRQHLLVSSRGRDLRAVLRVLRERVADAAGLIEDGSARGEQGTVLGLLLDAPSMRPQRRAPAMRGAPDVIAASTDTVARALGFREGDRFDDGVDGVGTNVAALVRNALRLGLVAVSLPAPAWHAPHMASLVAAIDVGTVTSSGIGVRGGERPVFRLSTEVDGVPIPLVLWPTTIGGNQRVQLDSGDIVRRNKASPAGMFVWRWLLAAPVWYPPRSTPDDELVLRSTRGVVVNDEGIGPSYRSAFGLMLLQHHDVSTHKDGTTLFSDTGVRTHGTGSVRSVLTGGVSHGCHRLLPRSALRLGTFILRHRDHTTSAPLLEGYRRDLNVGGKTLHLQRNERGTRTELTPPIQVEVALTCPING